MTTSADAGELGLRDPAGAPLPDPGLEHLTGLVGPVSEGVRFHHR